MIKRLLYIFIFAAFSASAQNSSTLLPFQANPPQNVDNPTILGTRLELSQYRIYAFNKYAIMDTINVFATKHDMLSKLQKPLGNSLQYLRGDGSVWPFPTIPTSTSQLSNNSGFISSESDPVWTSEKSFYSTKAVADALYRPISYVPSWTSISGKPVFSNIAFSSDYNDLINRPSIPSYLPGAGISIINNTITNTNVFPSPTYNNSPAVTLNVSRQLSATRAVRVSYTVSSSIQLTLLVGNGNVQTFLEISPNSSIWTTINSVGFTETLSVAVATTRTQTNNLQGEVPAGWYVRLRTQITQSLLQSGTTITFVSGQEVIN